MDKRINDVIIVLTVKGSDENITAGGQTKFLIHTNFAMLSTPKLIVC